MTAAVPMTVVAVVGPTATGKSDLAVQIAGELGAEVVNADAMQLYRGMDIGTAKLSVAQRRGIAHHQLDVLDVDQEASVASYQRHARADLAALRERQVRAVVVGGSGLYLRALLDRMELPPTDPAVRARLEERAASQDPAELVRQLAVVDPVAAQRIGPNRRRLLRALEVIELTGAPYSATLPDPAYQEPTLQIGLDCRREVLDSRIADRVDRMWVQGLVAEVRALAARGLGRTASRALGYSQVLAMLRGELTEAQAQAELATGTRRLARRQMGWFGRDRRIHWLDVTEGRVLDRALELIGAGDAGRLAGPAGGRRRLGS